MFMKNIITMAATGLVIFAGLGWYLDWYKVASRTTPDGNKHFDIEVNTKRIESDIEKGRNQVTGYLNNNALGGFPPGVAPPAGINPIRNPPNSAATLPEQGFPQPTNPAPLPARSPWVPAAA
jgi:hypothetical protein